MPSKISNYCVRLNINSVIMLLEKNEAQFENVLPLAK